MGYYYFDYTYFLYMLPALVLSLYAQFKVKATFEKYSRVTSSRGLTGREAAEAVLRFGSVRGVSVRQIPGSLTDHFDPRTGVISLSAPAYNVSSISAVGVAAHEAGHAIQHAVGYLPNRIRSFLVPVTNFGSRLSMPLILIGLLNVVGALVGGVALDQAGVLYPNELAGAEKVLRAAALTYLAATFTSLMSLLRLLAIVGSRRRRD